MRIHTITCRIWGRQGGGHLFVLPCRSFADCLYEPSSTSSLFLRSSSVSNCSICCFSSFLTTAVSCARCNKYGYGLLPIMRHCSTRTPCNRSNFSLSSTTHLGTSTRTGQGCPCVPTFK